MEISPKEFGLNPRVKLKHIAPNNLAIVKQVKSRIIQKDAYKLIKIADVIKKKNSNIKISLICYNNICSKSIKLLNESNIDVIISE